MNYLHSDYREGINLSTIQEKLSFCYFLCDGITTDECNDILYHTITKQVVLVLRTPREAKTVYVYPSDWM